MRVYVSDVGVTKFVCVRGGYEFLEALVTIFVFVLFLLKKCPQAPEFDSSGNSVLLHCVTGIIQSTILPLNHLNPIFLSR